MAPSADTAASSQAPVIRVRAYRPEDHAAVVELFAAGMMHYAHLPTTSAGERQVLVEYVEHSKHDDLAAMEATYVGSGGHFWVATAADAKGEDVVVGMVGVERKPSGEGELRRLSVAAAFRRFGVARLLVATLEDWVKQHEMPKIWLSTGALALQARTFYASMGYTLSRVEVFSAEPHFELVYFEKCMAA